MKSQESKSSNFYNIQSPFCVDQLIIAVASLVLHNIWRSDQSDSTPDIPGKILLPGPRKWTKVTRPSLAVGERCGLGTRLMICGIEIILISYFPVHVPSTSVKSFFLTVSMRLGPKYRGWSSISWSKGI